MEEVETFDPLDKRAALLLTYSGSLLSLHPLKTGDRSMDYTSIGLRKDVPESLHLPKGNLAETAEKGQPLSFQDSPLKQTSPLFAIMTCPGELELEDQKNLLDQASTVIIDSFVQLNKDFLEE